MDGAGSLIAANYTYNKADRDGTFIGVWNSAFVLYQALGDKAVRLDARKLNWIGAPIKGSPGCNIMGFTGLKTMDDVVKSRAIAQDGIYESRIDLQRLAVNLEPDRRHEVQRDQRL